ncbi:Vacuolar protein sorting-associated protein 8 [Sesamum angolense]|uniref:Vacuolar protein sorting-associated protein 8 n=1 Tax=Sesamum angolense TaxID=2727404 RepID=A0AAE1X7C1_9LAMI|nr:Vacuolar protein sorting-associated protein 8 [Sesamum angolense]
MLMEQSSAVDLDWLLQSHGEIISDENSPDRHYRTVDEILLNYSSSSPSPPSSPSTSYSAHQHSRPILKDDDYVSTGVRSSRNQRWSHSHASSLVESDKYSSVTGPASNSNRTKSVGRVLPQLFGTGAIRSNAKPGAALAAAAAASRSVTTPHATAIKLRRATTGVLKRSVSETTEKIAASDDSSLSPSAVASRVSENGSDAGASLESLVYSATQGNKSHEEEEVKLEQFLMGNTNADSQETDAGGGYSAGDRVQENFDKVADDATNCRTLSEAADDNGKQRVDKVDECKMPTSESQKASPIENEKDLGLDKVNLNEHVFCPLLDENIEEYPEVYPADESGKNDKAVGPTTILTDNDHKEDLTGGEASDFGNVVAETGNGDAASTQSVVADMLGDLALMPEKKVDHTNLQQNSHPSLKPLELAEEIEKKQAFTGLHYEEGAAAQPMRLEGVPRGSTVLGYFDADPNNAITLTISSQAFRREHGSPQVVAVHLNYIAIGMSRGSIFVQPSKYTAHQVDNMDGKMMSLGLQGDRTHVPVTSMCFNQQGDLLFAGYGDGHYTVWDVQKASALKVITEHKAPVVHMLYLGQDTQVTRQFNVVSGDSKGVVKLIRFSVVPWLNRISYTKSMKLLDETTSRVVCASPLLYGEGHAGAMISSQSSSALTTSSISSMMGTMVDEGVVIFITHQSALVVVLLCREHRLHCALIYLFNKGLDDFRTPLEELLVVLRSSIRENATCLGYRVLVYLKYCFKGLAFPPGRGNLSPTRLPSLRKELLHFLLEDSSAPNSWAVTRLPLNRAYANLLHLLELDTEATLEVLKCAFTDVELPKSTHSFQESTNFNVESVESQKLVQKLVDILYDILDASYFQAGSPICSNDVDLVEVWPSKKDVGHMFDFIAYYIAHEQAKVPRDILSQILEYLTSEINLSDMSGTTIEVFKRRERQLLSLLQVVPGTDWDAPYLLYLSEKAQFHQVCGYIHAIRHQYIAALESYMKANHEPVYAFSFIHDMLRLLSNGEFDAFESAIISRIPDLFKLSREATYILIIDHFSGRTQYIFSELRSHPESLFLYLKTCNEVHTTGNLNLSCLGKVEVLDFPSARRAQQQSTGVQAYLETISSSLKLLHNNQVNMTDEMTELYFELLCRYDRDSVLKFLETSESYRVEHCLHLCQEYGIVNAASFLLERVGDVGSALLLILSDVNDKFVMLDAEIEKTFSDTVVNNLNVVLKIKVVAEILDVVHACIGLCQRNSPRLKPEDSEYLWFQLLDLVITDYDDFVYEMA